MEQSIKLTEAELKMIELKREKDAIEAKEKAIKRELAIQDNKNRLQAMLDKEASVGQIKYNKLEMAMKTLNKIAFGEYELNEGLYKKSMKVRDPDDYRTEIDEVTQLVAKPFIKHKTLNYTIHCEEHFIQGRFHTGKSAGYKFIIQGPGIKGTYYYKYIETVHKKIKEILRIQASIEHDRQAKMNKFEKLMSKASELWPGAEVKKEGYGYYSGRNYNTVEAVLVTFPNNIKVYITPYGEKDFTINKVVVPSYGVDAAKIMEGLSHIEVKKLTI